MSEIDYNERWTKWNMPDIEPRQRASHNAYLKVRNLTFDTKGQYANKDVIDSELPDIDITNKRDMDFKFLIYGMVIVAIIGMLIYFITDKKGYDIITS